MELPRLPGHASQAQELFPSYADQFERFGPTELDPEADPPVAAAPEETRPDSRFEQRLLEVRSRLVAPLGPDDEQGPKAGR
jgi:hypothetical protein